MESTNDELNFSRWFADAFTALEVNPSEVAKKIGINNAKLYNILNGKFRPGYETVQQILIAYPRLNANWLLKGQLPILHNSGAEIVGVANSKKLVTLPFLMPTNNFDFMPTNYTYSVLANDDVQSLSDCVVVKLTDSSMAPRYSLGMRLLARPVKIDDWDYVNSALVLVLYRTTLVVRRIKENELPTKNLITLHADNSDSGFVIVKRDELKSIWQIIDIVGVDSLP
jgi:repressor LexA